MTEKKRIRMTGAAEMLIKCQLETLRELLTKFDLKLNAMFMPSEMNKTNSLT